MRGLSIVPQHAVATRSWSERFLPLLAKGCHFHSCRVVAYGCIQSFRLGPATLSEAHIILIFLDAHATQAAIYLHGSPFVFNLLVRYHSRKVYNEATRHDYHTDLWSTPHGEGFWAWLCQCRHTSGFYPSIASYAGYVEDLLPFLGAARWLPSRINAKVFENCCIRPIDTEMHARGVRNAQFAHIMEVIIQRNRTEV